MIQEVKNIADLALVLAMRMMPEESAKQSADEAKAAADRAEAAAEVAQRPYLDTDGTIKF